MGAFSASRLAAFKIRPQLADFLACLAGVAYAAQLWYFAQVQLSVLDEGLYLYKGLLLASGQYVPFADEGLWMTQMPLAYLLPGWGQLLLGAGLRSARLLAPGFSLLGALGLWLSARRLTNPWLAAGLLWAMTLNPALARLTATATSQGLTAFLLAWMFFWGLGRERSPGEVFAAGALAGAVVMVRINLLLLLPLWALYLWAANRRALGWGLAGMSLVFGGLHALYWPNILRLWAKWLPLPFLNAFSPPPNTPTWNPSSPLGFRIASLFLAFRWHFAALFGAFCSLTLGRFWRRRPEALFLLVFFWSSFALHAWAALGNDYCVFCFSTYTVFYAGAGLLLTVLTVLEWDFSPRRLRAWLAGLGTTALLGGMGYAAEGALRDLLPHNFYRRLVSLPAPGFGGAQLWQVWVNKWGGDLPAVTALAQALTPIAAGMLMAWLALTVGNRLRGRPGLGRGMLLLGLTGALMAFSPLLAGERGAYECEQGVIDGYEAAGAVLKQVIPTGAKVYWAGYSPVPLLYLPQVEILPGQLHGVYALRLGKDDAALRRYGWWSESLGQSWLETADFVIVEERNAAALEGRLQNFEQTAQTGPQSCEASSALRVYTRKRQP